MPPKTKTTVAEAIRIGKNKAYWPALGIFLGILCMGFPMMNFLPIHPGLSCLAAFLAATFAAWAWWGYHIVQWRFWAVAHVDDLLKLGIRARENDLIHNGLQEIGKFEIAGVETRAQYKKWFQQHLENDKDETAEDRSLPSETVLYYSWWSQANEVFLLVSGFAIIGIYLTFSKGHKMAVLLMGFASLALGLYNLIPFARRKSGTRHALKINNRWIQFENQSPVPWDSIDLVMVVNQGTIKHPRYYLTLLSNEGNKAWEVTWLNMSVDKLDHILTVYQTRAKKLNPTNA